MPRKAAPKAEGRVRRMPKKTQGVVTNREVRKGAKELDTEIKHVTVETTQRRGNNLPNDDQDARLRNLRNARGQQN